MAIASLDVQWERLADEVDRILDGIDRMETENPEGWWETNQGADFGKKKREEVRAAIKRHFEVHDEAPKENN